MSAIGAMSLNPITVLILSYHFHPSTEIGARRATALARSLVAAGLRVVVVSAFGGRSIELGQEVISGVFAIPVRRPKRRFIDLLVRLKGNVPPDRGDSDSPARPVSNNGADLRKPLINIRGLLTAWRDLFFRLAYFVDEHNTWSWAASKTVTRWGRHYSAKLIWISSPPHSVQVAGSWAARKLGIPYIADFRDPWSDYIVWTSPEQHMELRVTRALEQWVVRHAAAVTSTSATVADLLVERNPQIVANVRVIRNGYDGEVKSPMATTGGRLSMLFAGELYLGRDPFPLLNAMEWLLSRPEVDRSRIQLIFMGKVATYGCVSLEGWLRGKLCSSVVQILPSQSPQRVADAVLESTVLVNLAQQQRLSVPAKTFEQLASGREILLLCEAADETARLVAGITGVMQVDPLIPHALNVALLDLYERHVVREQSAVPSESEVQQYSRATANLEFHDLIGAVLAATQSS